MKDTSEIIWSLFLCGEIYSQIFKSSLPLISFFKKEKHANGKDGRIGRQSTQLPALHSHKPHLGLNPLPKVHVKISQKIFAKHIRQGTEIINKPEKKK